MVAFLSSENQFMTLTSCFTWAVEVAQRSSAFGVPVICLLWPDMTEDSCHLPPRGTKRAIDGDLLVANPVVIMSDDGVPRN